MASNTLLNDHYAKLCDTLTDIDNLLPHFVEEKVITINDVDEINAIVPSTKKHKVQKLMTHISGPLTAGNTEVFYTMLRIMEDNGHQATQQLANQIRRSLPITSGHNENTSHSNIDDMNVQTEMVNNNERQVDQQLNNVSYKHNPVMSIIILVLVIILLIELKSLQHQVSTLSTTQSVSVLDSDTITEMQIKCKPLLDYENNSEDTKFQGTDTFPQQMVISIKDQYQVTPAILNESKNDNISILSNPFFTSKGHLMIIKVYPNGFGTGWGTHISVFILLMKGPYDDELEQSGHWPLRGTFRIELLNQLNDSDHYIRMIQFHHYFCSECTNRVLKGVIANKGFGHEQFISLDILQRSNSAYHNNGLLIFRISYEDIEPPFQVTPVTFKLTNFSQWLNNKQVWTSSSFFAYDRGYQMILRVDAASSKGETPCVAVYLYLMKGPHDDELEQSGHWPLRGTFTIELVDQSNTSSYHRFFFLNDEICIECTKRVMHEDDMGKGYGGYFISHNDLYNYYNSKTLYFRVSYNSYRFYASMYVSLTVLIKFLGVALVNDLISFVMIVCTEICRNKLKICKVAISLAVINHALIHLIFLQDISIYKSLFTSLAFCAVGILNRLIWEFTGIISYQAFLAIDYTILRIFFVYFSLKIVYFYRVSNQTLVVLNPIMLTFISIFFDFNILAVTLVLSLCCLIGNLISL